MKGNREVTGEISAENMFAGVVYVVEYQLGDLDILYPG